MTPKKAYQDIDFNDSQYFLNRDLSWLEFNYRVLHEALDDRTPLLERLKFCAIFSANLDEFFMVRISTLKEQAESDIDHLTPDGRTPLQQLSLLEHRLRPLVEEQHRHFQQQLRPQLKNWWVHLLNYRDLTDAQSLFLQAYFEQNIFPVLTPLAVDPGHPFPKMSNLSLNLGVVVVHPSTGADLFARIKVPDILPRFISLPTELQPTRSLWTGIPLEEVIGHNLSALFPGRTIKEYFYFRITRDADFPVREDEAEDLMQAIQTEVNKRRFQGAAVRLELQSGTCNFVRETLKAGLRLQEADIYEAEGLLNLKDLFFFLSLPLPKLKDVPWKPVIPPRLERVAKASQASHLLGTEDWDDIFSVIRQGDVLVHHPYESFADSVELFITQAASDPEVLAIKMTLYRTSSNSPIVQALLQAAENGKQVAVLVELKARFDEESNIQWAQKLEESGVHVIYGLLGLKTHTKTTLVVRREGDRLRRYVHIGTGNYNPKTAGLYTDLGLLSCREELGADLSDLFNYLTGYSSQSSYRQLLVSPVSLRQGMLDLIQREIDQARLGNPAHIIAKMNSLVDPEMIRKLYEASQAGVKIELIIRGICCLRPGVAGVSENIQVVSIVGRFLEHARIFYFFNHNQPEVYIGSADWMPRNLDRRVEAVTPIADPELKMSLKMLLSIQLADNRHAWDLQPDGSFIQRHPLHDQPPQDSQTILMEQVTPKS
jgi:polyphosphate kinase